LQGAVPLRRLCLYGDRPNRPLTVFGDPAMGVFK